MTIYVRLQERPSSRAFIPSLSLLFKAGLISLLAATYAVFAHVKTNDFGVRSLRQAIKEPPE
jgi:hypothetical protein